MENFTYQNPTKLIFGKGQLDQLKNEVPSYGNRVLLVYGGGSIKRNGLVRSSDRNVKRNSMQKFLNCLEWNQIHEFQR